MLSARCSMVQKQNSFRKPGPNQKTNDVLQLPQCMRLTQARASAEKIQTVIIPPPEKLPQSGFQKWRTFLPLRPPPKEFFFRCEKFLIVVRLSNRKLRPLQ